MHLDSRHARGEQPPDVLSSLHSYPIQGRNLVPRPYRQGGKGKQAQPLHFFVSDAQPQNGLQRKVECHSSARNREQLCSRLFEGDFFVVALPQIRVQCGHDRNAWSSTGSAPF